MQFKMFQREHRESQFNWRISLIFRKVEKDEEIRRRMVGR